MFAHSSSIAKPILCPHVSLLKTLHLFRSNIHTPRFLVHSKPKLSLVSKQILSQPYNHRFYCQELNKDFRKLNGENSITGLSIYSVGAAVAFLGLILLGYNEEKRRKNPATESSSTSPQIDSGLTFEAHDLANALGISVNSIQSINNRDDGYSITFAPNFIKDKAVLKNISDKLLKNDVENSISNSNTIKIEKDGIEDFLLFMKKVKNPYADYKPIPPRIEGEFPLTLKELENVIGININCFRKMYKHDEKLTFILKPSFKDWNLIENVSDQFIENDIENSLSLGRNYNLTIQEDGVRDFLNFVIRKNYYKTPKLIQTPPLTYDPKLPFPVDKLCAYLKINVNSIRKIYMDKRYYNYSEDFIIQFKPSFKGWVELKKIGEELKKQYGYKIELELMQNNKIRIAQRYGDFIDLINKQRSTTHTNSPPREKAIDPMTPVIEPKQNSWIDLIFSEK